MKFVKMFRFILVFAGVFFAVVSCVSPKKEEVVKKVEVFRVAVDNRDSDSSNDILDFDNPILKNIPLNPTIIIEFFGDFNSSSLNMSYFYLQSQSTGEVVERELLQYDFNEETRTLTVSFSDPAFRLKHSTSYKVVVKKNFFGSKYSLLYPLSFTILTVGRSNSKNIILFNLSENKNVKYIRGSVVGKISSEIQEITLPYYPAIAPESIGSVQDGRYPQLILVPDISHTGVSVSPPSGEPQVFAELEKAVLGDREYVARGNVYVYKYKAVQYTVTASDGSKKVFKVTAKPQDKELPLSVPRNIKLKKLTNSTIDITWDSPSSTGVHVDTNLRARISIYTIKYKKSGTDVTQNPIKTTETKTTLKNLDFNSTYIITIVAENEAGNVSLPVIFVAKTTL